MVKVGRYFPLYHEQKKEYRAQETALRLLRMNVIYEI